MTNTTTFTTRVAASAGINRLFHFENAVAQVYADVRHRLGPGAPVRLFELEGTHRNRATRLEQLMRDHLIHALPSTSGPATITGLATRLERQQDLGEVFVLLREIERELLAAYESGDEAVRIADDAHEGRPAPTVDAVFVSDQRASLAAIEEECLRPHQPSV